MQSTNTFQSAEQEYFRLKGQLAAGRITREQFDAALKQLMIQDAQGRYWSLNPDSGKWLVYDGRQWVQASPPASPPTSLPERGGVSSPGSLPERLPPPPPPMLPESYDRARRRNSSLAYWFIGGGIGVILLLVFILGLVIVRGTVTSPSPVAQNQSVIPSTAPTVLVIAVPPTPIPAYTGTAIATPAPPTPIPAYTSTAIATPVPTFATSPRSNKSKSTSDQQLVSAMLGQPSFFVINMAPDGDTSPATIQSNWYYPNRKVSYTFIDGAYVGSDDILTLPAGLRLPSVSPDQFRPGMTLAQVQGVIGTQAPITHKPPNSVLEDTEFDYYPGIEVAFQKGQLVYVKTYPYGATSSMQLPAPIQFTLIQVSMLAYPPGSRYARAMDIPAALFPDPSAVLGPAKEIYDLYSDIKNLYDTGNFIGLSAEIKGSIQFLREQQTALEDQAKSETDPLKKTILLNAADRARLKANGLQNDVMPTLQAQQRGYACSKIPLPLVGSMLIRFGCGENPDPDRLRKLFEEYLGDVKGRPGQVRDALKEWLTNLKGGFCDLPADARESVVTSLIDDKLQEACSQYERNTSDYSDCADRAMISLRHQFGELNVPGNQEIVDELNRRLNPNSPLSGTNWVDGYVDGIANQLTTSGQPSGVVATVKDDLRNCLTNAMKGCLSQSNAIARCESVIKNVPPVPAVVQPPVPPKVIPPSLPQHPPGSGGGEPGNGGSGEPSSGSG